MKHGTRASAQKEIWNMSLGVEYSPSEKGSPCPLFTPEENNGHIEDFDNQEYSSNMSLPAANRKTPHLHSAEEVRR